MFGWRLWEAEGGKWEADGVPMRLSWPRDGDLILVLLDSLLSKVMVRLVQPPDEGLGLERASM